MPKMTESWRDAAIVMAALAVIACGPSPTASREALSTSKASPRATETPTPIPTLAPSPTSTPGPTPRDLRDLGSPYRYESYGRAFEVTPLGVERFDDCQRPRRPLTAEQELVEVRVSVRGISGFAVVGSRDFRLEDAWGRTYGDYFAQCAPYVGLLWPPVGEGDVVTGYLYFAAPRGVGTWLTYTDADEVARWLLP